MKWISFIVLLFISFPLFSQEDTPFGKYVFRESNIGYDEVTKKLIVPNKDDKYRQGCREKFKPNRYTCSQGDGVASIYINEESPGNFETTVFHPNEKAQFNPVSISSVIKDGKIVQQSRCLYIDKWTTDKKDKDKIYYRISKMECYVASAEMCNLFSSLETIEDLESPENYSQFLKILKSPKYKQQLLEAQKLNYRNAFLHSNRDENYDYYSKLPIGFYDVEKQGKIKDLSIVNFEESLAVKESKSLRELASNAKVLMLRVFIEPCSNLSAEDILDKSTIESSESVPSQKKNSKTGNGQ